jgi:hypothetical protein
MEHWLKINMEKLVTMKFSRNLDRNIRINPNDTITEEMEIFIY